MYAVDGAVPVVPVGEAGGITRACSARKVPLVTGNIGLGASNRGSVGGRRCPARPVAVGELSVTLRFLLGFQPVDLAG